jgi:hypothetical protein
MKETHTIYSVVPKLSRKQSSLLSVPQDTTVSSSQSQEWNQFNLLTSYPPPKQRAPAHTVNTPLLRVKFFSRIIY